MRQMAIPTFLKQYDFDHFNYNLKDKSMYMIMGLTNHCCQMNAPTGNSHISESFTQAFLPHPPSTLMASVWDTNDNDKDKDKDKDKEEDKDRQYYTGNHDPIDIILCAFMIFNSELLYFSNKNAAVRDLGPGAFIIK